MSLLDHCHPNFILKLQETEELLYYAFVLDQNTA